MTTKREIELERIKAEAGKFFDYPTADKSHVSTNSMILFCEFMLEIERLKTLTKGAQK